MHVVVLGHFLSLLSAQSNGLSLRRFDEYAIGMMKGPEDKPRFLLGASLTRECVARANTSEHTMSVGY
jgi:hypothetical protein